MNNVLETHCKACNNIYVMKKDIKVRTLISFFTISILVFSASCSTPEEQPEDGHIYLTVSNINDSTFPGYDIDSRFWFIDSMNPPQEQNTHYVYQSDLSSGTYTGKFGGELGNYVFFGGQHYIWFRLDIDGNWDKFDVGVDYESVGYIEVFIDGDASISFDASEMVIYNP
jgi:hypothetical protein